MFHHIRGPFRPQDIPVEGERNANIANDEDVGEGGIGWWKGHCAYLK